MTAVSAERFATPTGLVAMRRLRETLRRLWDCGVPGCDGSAGHPLPWLGGVKHPYRHARAEQLAPPGVWYVWLLMTGRGFGKTRSAAEFVKKRALAESGHRVAIICPDFAVGRDVCVEGESGLRGAVDGQGVIPWDRIRSWNKTTGELVLTNDSRFQIFSTHTANDAESIRGSQFHTVWFEELATQRYASVAWDNAEMALRLGDDPRIVVSTTPRKVQILRRLLKDPTVVVTRGSTLSNAANLPAATVRRLIAKYQGTTLGRQELDGEMLNDVMGALFAQESIDKHRFLGLPVDGDGTALDFDAIYVGVDPSGSHKVTSDETGIVVLGVIGQHYYALASAAGHWTPSEWRAKAIGYYWHYEATAVVAETNCGLDMVRQIISDADKRVQVTEVHATRGKALRAESTQMVEEQGRLHIVGVQEELENEMTTWIAPGMFDNSSDDGEPVPIPHSSWSPNLLDALVWCVTEALLPSKRRTIRGATSVAEEIKMLDPTASDW